MVDTSTLNGRYGDEVFAHERSDERDRLDALTRSLDEISFARLDTLPIRPDSRCLDIGAGTGTVAASLADRAASGHVIALDRSIALLDPNARENLEVVEADITTAEFPPGSFDVIHARLVLQHLSDREEVIGRAVSWLAPGGWILLSEGIDPFSATSPNDLYSRLMAGFVDALYRTMGTDMNCARSYPAVLAEHGIVNIGIDAHVPPVSGGSPTAEFFRLSCGQLREVIVSAGHLDNDEFDAAMALLDDPTFVDLATGMMSVWGQRG
ncbi:trans-aconitate 2-methyltransferase [Rhodococcus sp. TAF43]|uniref:class I SAM-dependent methyltransferase n=1 Tax=Rhodococcus sp. TAF43 TaxID=3237483 RepID=UPI003F9BAC19